MMSGDPMTEDLIEVERYELREGPAYRFEVNRRQFVQLLGAGLVVSFSPDVSLAQRSSGRGSRNLQLSQRLHIGADGVVTVMTSKVEVGQGSRTEITQAAAEELGVAVDRIRVIMADTDLTPNDGGTFGSLTTPRTIPQVRRAAAAAKQLLIELAAETWKTDAKTLIARDGKVIDSGSGREVTFGELARSESLAPAFERPMPEGVEVTRVEQWKVMGTSVTKIGGEDVVTGRQRYPSDLTLPGMLYGKVLRSPAYGSEHPEVFTGNLVSIDLEPAEQMEGVVVVRDENFVAVAAPTSKRAQDALDVLAETARWSFRPHPPSGELFKYLKDHAADGTRGTRRPRVQETGSVADAMAAAEKTLSASYEIAYIQHVPMETRAAVAQWSEARLTVWVGTQTPNRVKSQLARAFRLDADRVRVIVPDTGGGFGGKHTGEVAIEAARIAKSAGVPVSLQWTREEEFTWAYFRPAGLIEIEAGLDKAGKIAAWDFTNINSGASSIRTPYAVANTTTRFKVLDAPIMRQGSYRSLASAANTFARESFMDELASAAGVDPLQFRLRHIENERLRNVLQAAAQRFGWDDRGLKGAENRGIGLACGTDKGSYVAACASVEVDPASGKIKVLEVCEAFECGAILNPLGLRKQVEGGLIMGLGGALTEEIRFEEGRILNPRLSEYPVPRFEDVPEIEIVLLDRPDLDSAGSGETPIIAVAPALGNAVFNATGIRVRSLPLRPDGLKKG